MRESKGRGQSYVATILLAIPLAMIDRCFPLDVPTSPYDTFDTLRIDRRMADRKNYTVKDVVDEKIKAKEIQH